MNMSSHSAPAQPRLGSRRPPLKASAGTRKISNDAPSTRRLSTNKSLSSKSAGKPSSSTSSTKSAKVQAREAALAAMGGVKIDVFVRIRPPNKKESTEDKIVRIGSDHHECILQSSGGKTEKHQFDQVFDKASSQLDIYTRSVASIVDEVVSGVSCAIFAYGQTGAGKTYTMRGKLDNSKEHGIIQRSTAALIKKMNAKPEYTDVQMTASFLEIYNETLEDLLFGAGGGKNVGQPPRLTLVDDKKHGCWCNGLSEWEFDDPETVMSLLDVGEKRAKVAATKMNKQSNRAHRIFIIKAKYKQYDVNESTTLTFVDLAGSEDIGRSGATGGTAKEAGHINKSLLALGRVIDALAANEKHIPYRDSKLTQLLSEALGGMCKTTFITCVSPAFSSLRETEKTVKYATRALEALNISQLPRHKQDQIVIDGLTRRVEALLAMLEKQSKAHHEQTKSLKDENKRMRDNEIEIMEKLGKLPEICSQDIAKFMTICTEASQAVQNENGEQVDAMISKFETHINSHSAGIRALQDQSSKWSSQSKIQIDDVKSDNKLHIEHFAKHTATVKTIKDRIGEDTGSGANLVLRLKDAYSKDATTKIANVQETLSKSTANVTIIADEASGRIQSSNGKLSDGLGLQSKHRDSSMASLQEHDSKLHNALVMYETTSKDHFSRAMDATKTYVEQEIKRDTQIEPHAKDYPHPVKFASTPSAAIILGDTFAEGLSREDKIENGTLVAGPNVDYPNVPGDDDFSDPINATADRPHSPITKDVLETAAYESDPEEYDEAMNDDEISYLLWPNGYADLNDIEYSDNDSADNGTPGDSISTSKESGICIEEQHVEVLDQDPDLADSGPTASDGDAVAEDYTMDPLQYTDLVVPEKPKVKAPLKSKISSNKLKVPPRRVKQVKLSKVKGFPLDSLGCKCKTAKGTVAVIRFVGYDVEGKGPRVGIELPEPKGKHNGSVKGYMYFQCEENHGLLVHPEKVTLITELGMSL